MRRHVLGFCAIAFLAGAISLHLWGGGDDNAGWLMSVCQRVGLLLGAIWLAMPQLSQVAQRMPPWLTGGILFAGLVTAVRPKWIIFLVPLLAAMALLQFWGWLFKPLPNAKRKPNRSEPE